MASAGRGMVETLRDSDRFRYYQPCRLRGHEIVAVWRRTLALEWVKDCQRTTRRLMRRVDTGFEV